MVNIDEFSKIVKDYIENILQGKYVSAFRSIDHAFICNWSRTSKLVITTIHKFPATWLDSLLPKIIGILEADNTAPGRVDVFSYHTINDVKKNIFKNTFAKAGLDLILHDQQELATEPYFGSIYDTDSDLSEQDFASDLLCKYLINGKGAIDLKNIVLRSNITLLLFAKPKQSYEELLSKIQEKLGKNVDSIKSVVRKLEKEGKIINYSLNPNLYMLSEHEAQQIQSDIKNGNLEERNFKERIIELIQDFEINVDVNKIIDILVSVYKQHSGIDAISNQANNASNAKEYSIYQEIRQEITTDKLEDNQYKAFLAQLKDICSDSSYLNRIVRNEAFQKLYSSNKLADFLSKRECFIYLDTPVLIYLLCSKTVFATNGINWNDYFYNSTINLLRTKRNRFKTLTFTVMYNYLLEVAGEIRKALRTAWFFEKNPKLPILPETANTFYNYYKFLLTQNALPKGTNFFSFVHDNFNVSIQNSEDKDFIKIVASDIYKLLTALKFSIDSDNPESDWTIIQDVEYKYTMSLSKDKTNHAIKNDVRQTILLAEKSFKHKNDDFDYYFASWDRSTIQLKKWMNENYVYCYGNYRVDNPASLANRFSLSTLDIDSQSITYDVFAYADKEYNISSKIKDLYDNVIIPIFGSSKEENSHAATALLQIQKEYDDQQIEDEEDKPNEKLALERVFDGIFSKLPEWKTSINELSLYFTDDSNLSFITKMMQDSFAMIKVNKSFMKEIDMLGENLKLYMGGLNKEGEIE